MNHRKAIHLMAAKKQKEIGREKGINTPFKGMPPVS
jgi:hypothetical protein